MQPYLGKLGNQGRSWTAVPLLWLLNSHGDLLPGARTDSLYKMPTETSCKLICKTACCGHGTFGIQLMHERL